MAARAQAVVTPNAVPVQNQYKLQGLKDPFVNAAIDKLWHTQSYVNSSPFVNTDEVFARVFKWGKQQTTDKNSSSDNSQQNDAPSKKSPIGNMHVSKMGLQFLIDHEGIKRKPYNDSQHFATIGIGHLLHKSPVTEADRKNWGTISDSEAIELFKQDIVVFENYVKALVKVPLTQQQFDAIVSFAFNVGPGKAPNDHPGLKFSEFPNQLNKGNYNGNLMLHYIRQSEAKPGEKTKYFYLIKVYI